MEVDGAGPRSPRRIGGGSQARDPLSASLSAAADSKDWVLPRTRTLVTRAGSSPTTVCWRKGLLALLVDDDAATGHTLLGPMVHLSIFWRASSWTKTVVWWILVEPALWDSVGDRGTTSDHVDGAAPYCCPWAAR